jgi:hypothetical protein
VEPATADANDAHFTEGEEKGGGHGDVGLMRRWVRARVSAGWAALYSQDWLLRLRVKIVLRKLRLDLAPTVCFV